MIETSRLYRLPDVQWFTGKVTRDTVFHSFFVYTCAPTHWRENWRNISGFSVRFRSRYFTFVVWRQL